MLEQNYRNMMNRIKADDEFRQQLLNRLENEREKCNTAVSRPSFKRYIPAVAGIAAAFVLTLAVFASRAFIFPLVDDEDLAVTHKNTTDEDGTILGVLDNNTGSDLNANISEPDVETEINENKTVADMDNEATGTSEEICTNDTQNEMTDDSADEINAETQTYSIVTYSDENDVLIKGLATAEETIEYNTTLHFMFEGFENYGIGLVSNDVVFEKSLPLMYTLTDFFSDHYNTIIGENGELEMYDGLLDTFFNIRANSVQQINVYINGLEILNLDNALMSDFKDMTDVYFVVSVT